MNLRSKNNICLAAGLFAMTTLLAGCAGSTSTPVGAGNSAGSTASILGSVSSSVTSSLAVREAARKGLSPHERTATPTCASGTFSGAYVGGGGTVVTTGSFSANSFTIPSVPVGKELVVTFTCSDTSTQRCLVKAGDTGVSCNPVADAILAAFEIATSTLITDSSFSGKSIAKVASSIVAASNNNSTATEAFLAQITACKTNATPGACDQSAINGSIFRGSFQMMQALITGWTVPALFTLMADMYGFVIGIDPFIYSDFGTRLDTWLSTDFIANTRAFVNQVISDETNHLNNYVVKAVCQMNYNKGTGGGTITYYPTTTTVGAIANIPTCANVAALVHNGLGVAGDATTPGTNIYKILAAINTNSNGQIQLGTDSCSDQNSWGKSTYFCVNPPQLVITSKNSEADRNDPNGKNNNNFVNPIHVSLVNVLPSINTALSTASSTDPAPGGVACLSGNNPPAVTNNPTCNAWFGALLAPYAADFSGMMGLYLALKNNILGTHDTMSLNDIYTAFNSSSFLGIKLTDNNFPASGTSSTVGQEYLQAVLTDNGTNVFDLDPIFVNPTSPQLASKLESVFSAATVTYANSFKLFETIPTADVMHDYIFKSAYHVEFNPTGSKTFYVAANANATAGATSPIFCQMLDANNVQVEVDMTTVPNITLNCVDGVSQGVTVDASGNVTVPAVFPYPYGLAQFGYQGDSAGSIFTLVDWKTGFAIQPGGNQQFVYQQHVGNPIVNGPTGNCNSSDSPLSAGHEVSVLLNMANGQNLYQQNITAYCLDMHTFTSQASEGFYYGGNMILNQTFGDGQTISFGVQQVGGLNSTQANNWQTPPLCVFAPTTAFTFGAVPNIVTGGNVAFATTGATAGGITNLGSLVVDFCSAASTYPNDTQYYLIAMGPHSFASGNTTLRAQLVATSAGALPLQYAAFSGSGDPTSAMLYLTAAQLSSAFSATKGGSCVTSGSVTTCSYRAAPPAPPVMLQSVQLVSSAWEAKFDPYCDNVEGDGVCHCLDGTTNAAKAGNCTLEDVPTDPTISQLPYPLSGPTASAYAHFFATFGNLAGTALVSGPTKLNFDYLNNNNLMMDTSQVLTCAYLALGETTYRHPINLSNDWTQPQAGCPPAPVSGVLQAASPSTTGLVRVIKPVAMGNAYAVLHPNKALRLAGYATKDIGEGIAIDPNAKLFTFDTALALIAFRLELPVSNITIYQAGTTTPSLGSLASFQQVQDPAYTGNNGGGNNHQQQDPASAILCYLSSSGAGCQ